MMPRDRIYTLYNTDCTLQNYARCTTCIRRALMVILQSRRTQNVISKMPSQCICCASETYQILSTVLFRQSSFYFTEFCIHLSLPFFACTSVYISEFTHSIQASGALLHAPPEPCLASSLGSRPPLLAHA